MRIGELAKTAGLTPDTIRFYEREGLLEAPPRTPSGYRDYGPEVLDDLVFIRKAQLLGLRLPDEDEVVQRHVLHRNSPLVLRFAHPPSSTSWKRSRGSRPKG